MENFVFLDISEATIEGLFERLYEENPTELKVEDEFETKCKKYLKIEF